MALWCLLQQEHALADSPHPVIEALPPEQMKAAVRAAHMPDAVNLARSNLGIPAQATAQLHVADQGVCVYRLNPSFQQGQSDVPLAVPGYVAVTARTSDGRTTTLQVALVPSAKGGASSWTAVAAAQDDTEARLAQKIAKNTALFEDQGLRGREWHELDQQGLRALSIENGRLRRAAAIPITTYVKSLRRPAVQAPSPAPSPLSAVRNEGAGAQTWVLAGAGLSLAAGALVLLLRPRFRPSSRRHTGPTEETASS